jgi:hypothetical protein
MEGRDLDPETKAQEKAQEAEDLVNILRAAAEVRVMDSREERLERLGTSTRTAITSSTSLRWGTSHP